MRVMRGCRSVASVTMVWGLAACRHPNEPANATAPVHAGPAEDTAAAVATAPPTVDHRVTFVTRDGWTLVGTLHRGDAGPAVILMHQLASSRAEWGPLLARLQRPPHAWTTLAFDLRGHGESTAGPDGPTSWQAFGNDRERWRALERDVAAAVDSLGPEPRGGVFLVGSSIGSTAAIAFAAEAPTVQGMVLLSPGEAYRGVDISDAMQRFVATGRPALLLASEGDGYSAEMVRASTPAGPVDGDGGSAGGSAISARLYTGTDAHGVTMGSASAHPEMWNEIDRWLRTQRDVLTVGRAR